MRVQCSGCGHTLGVYDSSSGEIEIVMRSRHHGAREVMGWFRGRITCEKCGAVWTSPGSVGGSATASAA